MLNGAKFSYGHLEDYISFKLLNNELQTILIINKLITLYHDIYLIDHGAIIC